MAKWMVTTGVACGGIIISLSLAMANPAMLPKHPGHPMATMKDPVTGQSLTHDSGQRANRKEAALEEASRYHDKESVQIRKPDETIESQGAGQLPKLRGYPVSRLNRLSLRRSTPANLPRLASGLLKAVNTSSRN